jgi:signal transduction histidine kinase
MQKILVIDDEEQMRDLLRIALESRGFEVLDAMDGISGLELASREVPSLVLCDVNMGRLDGYETLARMRQSPATSTVPFILMTGMADNAGMRQGMELGADDYLPKPFTIPQLFAAVETRLNKAASLRLEAEKRLDALRANISMVLPHELRTPLNGILSFGEILAFSAEALQPAEVAEMGRDIYNSARKLERLVENALIYTQMELVSSDRARVEALRGVVAPDAANIIANQARTVAGAAGREQDLHLVLEDGPLAISGEHLSKLTGELLSNAFKFSSPGASVTVNLSFSPDHAELVVADQGRGMTPEQISKVGAYMQFDRQRFEQEGLGLGLAIARKLVELHRGNLTITSAGGTTISVCFPAAAGP